MTRKSSGPRLVHSGPRVTLRPATAEDRGFIESVYFRTQRWLIEKLFGWRGDDAERSKFHEFYDEAHTNVIQMNGESVGWLTVFRDPDSIEVGSIYLVPEKQGRGIGTFLAEQILAEGDAAQKRVTLSTAKINPACRLYERLGFVAVHETEFKVYLERKPREPVVLAAYDARWLEIFAREAEQLRSALESVGLESIEHVGSTAIPGMAAKPIVDIMAGVADLRLLPGPEDALWRSLGYQWGHETLDAQEWLYFVKRDAAGNRVAQLHVVRFAGEFWKRLIAFRDALRQDGQLAHEYAALKLHLTSAYGEDRLRYRDEKTVFVDGVLALAAAASRYRFTIERGGDRISIVDYGGEGPPALLLHGLYGGAHEWERTAQCLKRSHRVVALDQRGHGESAKRTRDLRIESLADDAAAVLQHVNHGRALVVGQSMGGVVAILLASRYPQLVERLVVIEAHAQSDASRTFSDDWLSSWPLPFCDLRSAARFFQSHGMDPNIWIQVVQRTEHGYMPKFSIHDMRALAAQLHAYDYGAECTRISAPTLVIHGSKSWLNGEKVREVARLIPHARFEQIEEAGHDVHLDTPEALEECLLQFVGQSRPRRGS